VACLVVGALVAPPVVVVIFVVLIVRLPGPIWVSPGSVALSFQLGPGFGGLFFVTVPA